MFFSTLLRVLVSSSYLLPHGHNMAAKALKTQISIKAREEGDDEGAANVAKKEEGLFLNRAMILSEKEIISQISSYISLVRLDYMANSTCTGNGVSSFSSLSSGQQQERREWWFSSLQ